MLLTTYKPRLRSLWENIKPIASRNDQAIPRPSFEMFP